MAESPVGNVMQLQINIEKSFEGEYRVVVRRLDGEFDIITMPWVVGKVYAIKRLGLLLSRKSADVLYAVETNTPMSGDFLRTFHETL